MKYLPAIASVLLGLMFIAGGVVFFVAEPKMPFPEGSLPMQYMTLMVSTKYMTLVKVLEILGGLLVVVPRTRNYGLLVLGPIIINIFAFQIFIVGENSIFQPPFIVIGLLAAYLLWSGRKAFAGLGRQ